MRKQLELQRIGHPPRSLNAAMGALVLTLLMGGAALAAGSGPKEPLLQADRMSYDENTNIITATGNVEVAMDDQILRADMITYNKTTNVVRATGHVAVTQSTGEIMHAKEIEMTSDMKEAFLSDIGILFPDSSRLAALDAQRYEGRYLVTEKGVYSACNLCADDPKKAPLWQVKGARVTHDSQEKQVMYRDATIEFVGVPLLYTPYFSHPDPSVKRRQGFLAPDGGHSATLGYMARTPYYFDLAPHSDLLLTPTFSQKDTLQVAAEWRHRFHSGAMTWSGSVARTDFVNDIGIDRGYQWRGHLFGTTQFDISDTWRAGTDVAFASDKSYMPRYKISSEDLLINRAYAERYSGRNYAVGNMYYFQDTRPGTRLKEPFVAPEVRVMAMGEPNETLGGRWALGTGMLVTTREKNVDPTEQGPNVRRLSVDAGWERQMASSTGFLTTVTLSARADGYWADNVPDPDEPLGTGFSKVERVRPFAQGLTTLRYPIGRQGDGYQQIVEPIAVLAAAPRVNRNTLIPNEDSLDVEFDETNLFSANRFTGIDRLEGGMRMAYGLRHALIGNEGGKIEMLGGQVFRAKKDLTFPEGSGLADEASDYVGRLGLSPAHWLDANYSFRLARKDLQFTRQQFSATLGTAIFRPSLRYLYSRQTEASTTEDERLEEASVGLSSAFTKYWSLSASHSHAFKPAPGPRSTAFGVTYKDECFEAGVSAERDYTERTDVETGTTVMFRFFMKNIGGWESDKMSAGM